MPKTSSDFPWPRYWFPEGNSNNEFVQSGYLSLPSAEYRHYYQALPKQLAELTQIPVLILLGEPGYGKSHALQDERKRLEVEHTEDLVIFEDLKSFVPGSEQRLLDSDTFKLVEQGRRLWILLDSFDECTLPAPGDWLISNFINKVKHPERVFVRITCRPSHWPEKLEEAFSERWRSVAKSAVESWRLCPLRQDDIRIAANRSQIDAEGFLNTVTERNVEQLAALPVTLQFMLRLFQVDRLPKVRTEIFEQGLELLCEDSPARQEISIKSQIPASDRFRVATRIALGYVLQGCHSIWLGPRVQCPIGLFDAKQVTCKEVSHEISDEAVKETLELTGIFARLDGKQFQFASRTFAEFLAACYIAESPVPTDQKLKVLLHPDSQRLIPDLHETAAWLAALDADFLIWLVNHEPEAALESDFATLAQADLPALVDGMLRLATEEQRPSYDWQRLAKLQYPGIESKLSAVITDSSASFVARALAIRIVNACELQTLGTELAELVLNDSEDIALRELATSRIANMADTAKKRLIPLAESTLDLSLKAKALSVIGPGLMGFEAFFNQISPAYVEISPHDLRFMIDEDSFLDQFDVEGLIVGLNWITNHVPIGCDSYTSNRLKSQLFVRAFIHLNEMGMVTTIVRAMKALRSHNQSFFDDLDRNKQQNPFDDANKRHIILTELINQIDLESVNDWIFFGERCFRQEDCGWLFQQYDQERSDEKRVLIATIINQLIQSFENREAVEEVLNRASLEVSNPDPILAECMSWLINPTDLTSQAAINSREQYFRLKALSQNNELRRQTKSLPNPPDYYIQTELEACEAGDFSHWSNLIASLALEKDGSKKFPHEPESLPGWQKADDTLRNRITEIALNYLENAETPNEKILLENSRTFAQAACGLAVIIVADTNNLQRLSGEHLSRWCLVIVTHFCEPETQQRIFKKLRPIVPDAFDDAVLKKIDREAEAGNLSLLQSCRKIWHADFLQSLADTRLNASNWLFSSRLSLAELLLKNNIDNIVQQLVGWLKNETDTANQCATAISLFRNAPVQAWDSIQSILTEDDEIAREVILAVAYSGGYSDNIYSDLDADQLGWLYDRIRALFPESEDPNDNDQVHTVTPRHDAGNMRNNMIGLLVKMATSEAVKELDRICQAYPDSPWLIRARADACKNLWRQERTRLSFAESIQLLSDAHASVVRNSRELMIVVEEALQRFAHEALHGSPPLAIFLWNEGEKKPYSEQRLSDFLKFYLSREFRGRRIIINREVEIQNWRDRGIGERADIFVDAIVPDNNSHRPNPCVVIEVKVDKNVKPEDIPEQLVGKYLDGESRTCGIYLVGWFGKSRSTISELREKVDKCASDNTSEEIKVNSIVLNLCHPLSPTN
jgi:hypothetical protein